MSKIKLNQIERQTYETLKALADQIDYKKPKAAKTVVKAVKQIQTPKRAVEPAQNIAAPEGPEFAQSAEKTEGAAITLNNEVQTEPEIEATEAPSEPAEASIFSDIANETAEDSKIGEIAEGFAEDIENSDPDNEIGSNAALRIKARTQTELIGVGMSLLLTVISWEFTLDNFNKWGLHKDRKKELSQTIYQVLLLDKKKTNPKRDLMYLIAGLYTPLLIMAIMTLFTKIKENREKAKQVAAEQAEIRKQQLKNNNFASAEPAKFTEVKKEVIKENKPEKPKGKKTEKRGRHKNSCASHKGKECNCK